MEPNENKESAPEKLMDRARRSWFAPLAVVGAVAAFGAAVFRVRPTPKPPKTPLPETALKVLPSAEPVVLPWSYALAATIGGSAPKSPFVRSLGGIAVGPGNRIYALADGDIRAFSPDGNPLSSWKAPQAASCISVGPDGRIYLGLPGRVEILDPQGESAGGFAAGEPEKPAEVTSIQLSGEDVLVADAAARLIRRYDRSGRQLGLIGDRNKNGNFMLPNRWLDMAVNSKGLVHVTDTGRHLVSSWNLDGSQAGAFGKFGMTRPEDFVGCCNPVNIAATPEGKIVTGEKMVARVKVYEPGGQLLALIGPENFDPQCTHIFLAVDSSGRILAADPVRREIKIFTRAAVNT